MHIKLLEHCLAHSKPLYIRVILIISIIEIHQTGLRKFVAYETVINVSIKIKVG